MFSETGHRENIKRPPGIPHGPQGRRAHIIYKIEYDTHEIDMQISQRVFHQFSGVFIHSSMVPDKRRPRIPMTIPAATARAYTV